MFTADMIAPCGLDCSLCRLAHDKDHPCAGCNGPNENKPRFCAELCGIVICEKRRNNGYEYCDECPEFPCEDVMEKESRYTTAYPLYESPLNNIRLIREIGMDAFLEKQRSEWTCKECGGPVCVQTGICRDCGRKYVRASREGNAQ